MHAPAPTGSLLIGISRHRNTRYMILIWQFPGSGVEGGVREDGT